MWIDYVVIILAVVAFAMQFAFTKIFEGGVKQTNATVFAMLIVMNLVGTLIYLCVGGFKVDFSTFSLFWACVLAVIMIPYYVIGIKVLSLGSLAVYSMFMMLGGMLVPFCYGLMFLNESVSWGKLVGSVCLTFFIVLQALEQNQKGQENNKQNTKTKYLFFGLCLSIFFINGMTSVVAKVHQIGENAVNEISFTVISCALTALISSVLLGISLCQKDRTQKKESLKKVFRLRSFLVMAVIGAAAYTGNFFLLKAATNVPASVQFPLVSGGVIVLSALVSAFAFRERLSKKEWYSVAGAFLSTLFFAF